MAKRRRRTYLMLLDSAKAAALSAIDSYNRVNYTYRNEATLILLANGWELLAKAVLVRDGQSIDTKRPGVTITAEVAVSRLLSRKTLEKHEVDVIQQIVSLRNEAIHSYLPDVPDEIMHHLLFFGCKFFREVIKRKFPLHAKALEKNYLSLSFSDLTTYADKVQKLVSRIRTSKSDKNLIWLLERGIAFDGKSYISRSQFEKKYKTKGKIMPYLEINNFLKETDMIRIVPVEAPKNYTADIKLRKGSARDASLPVVFKRTALEEDYPHLTKELAAALGKSQNFVTKAIQKLGLKGDPHFHQGIRTSKKSSVHRYSEAAKEKLARTFKEQPDFNPYSN